MHLSGLFQIAAVLLPASVVSLGIPPAQLEARDLPFKTLWKTTTRITYPTNSPAATKPACSPSNYPLYYSQGCGGGSSCSPVPKCSYQPSASACSALCDGDPNCASPAYWEGVCYTFANCCPKGGNAVEIGPPKRVCVEVAMAVTCNYV